LKDQILGDSLPKKRASLSTQFEQGSKKMCVKKESTLMSIPENGAPYFEDGKNSERDVRRREQRRKSRHQFEKKNTGKYKYERKSTSKKKSKESSCFKDFEKILIEILKSPKFLIEILKSPKSL